MIITSEDRDNPNVQIVFGPFGNLKTAKAFAEVIIDELRQGDE